MENRLFNLEYTMGHAAPTAWGHIVIPNSLDTKVAKQWFHGSTLANMGIECSSNFLSCDVGFQMEADLSMTQARSMLADVNTIGCIK